MKKKKRSRPKKKNPAGAQTLRIVRIESLAGEEDESMESAEQPNQIFCGQISYGKPSQISKSISNIYSINDLGSVKAIGHSEIDKLMN